MRRLILSLALVLGVPLAGQAQTVYRLRPLNKSLLSLYYWQAIPGGSQFAPSSGGAVYPVSDETFKVCDNGDATKCVEIEASGITTANTIVARFSSTAAAPVFALGTSTAQWSITASTASTNSIYNTENASHVFSHAGTPNASFTSGTGAAVRSTLQFCFASGDPSSTACDTGFERLSAGRAAVTDGSTGEGSLHIPLKMSYGGGSTITVDGATTFAATSSYHILACTGAETINTITGGVLGMQLVLLSNDTDCTIADDDTPTAANAVNLTGTATNDVGAAGKHLTLLFDGNAWQQIAESANN